MKLFRKIDTTTGNFLEDVLFESHPTLEDGELDPQYVEEAPSQGLYAPRWSGEAWEESLSLAEIEAIKAQAEPTEPTLEERVTATETNVVTLQETIDVIFGGV